MDSHRFIITPFIISLSVSYHNVMESDAVLGFRSTATHGGKHSNRRRQGGGLKGRWGGQSQAGSKVRGERPSVRVQPFDELTLFLT